MEAFALVAATLASEVVSPCSATEVSSLVACGILCEAVAPVEVVFAALAVCVAVDA